MFNMLNSMGSRMAAQQPSQLTAAPTQGMPPQNGAPAAYAPGFAPPPMPAGYQPQLSARAPQLPANMQAQPQPVATMGGQIAPSIQSIGGQPVASQPRRTSRWFGQFAQPMMQPAPAVAAPRNASAVAPRQIVTNALLQQNGRFGRGAFGRR